MEALCDRASIIREGRIVKNMGLDELFIMGEGKVEITARGYPECMAGEINKYADSVLKSGDETFIVVNRQEYVRSVIQHLLNNGAEILRVADVQSSLEEIFVSEVAKVENGNQNSAIGEITRVGTSV